ncbi:hypothetical protein [Saccharothrix yanglingensis]|uniref:hypothetical protein n=1 Tax=Saccharothrix yanglingensis TaxID=659496 RepID=UPI0027D2E3D3|nr:hypothetical protein [Saccharothrix yanglingensis]
MAEAGGGPAEVSRHDRVDSGGDPVCWLSRVCPECGFPADGEPAPVCPRCGAAVAEDEGGDPR